MKSGFWKKLLVIGLAVSMSAVFMTACGSGGGSTDEDLMQKVKDNGELVVTMNTGNKPWTYKENGEYTGLAIELVKGYCDELGVKCKIKPMKFESMIPALNKGKVDIVCTNLSRTVERSQNVMFTDSVGVDYGVVIVKKGTYKTLSAVNKKNVKLTTEAGSVWEDIAKDRFPKANMMTVDTTPNAFQAIKSGRADAFLTDAVIAEQLLANDSSVEVINEHAYTDVMAFAVNTGSQSSAFLNSFNVYLKNIKANGTFGKLWKKYIGETWDPNAIENSF